MLSNYRVRPEIQLKDPNDKLKGIWSKIYLSKQLEDILKGGDVRKMNEYRNKYFTQFVINTVAVSFLMACLFIITEYLTFQLNNSSFHWFSVLIALLAVLLVGGLFWIRFQRMKLITSWENAQEGVQVEEKDIETVTLIQPNSSYQPLKIPSTFLLTQTNNIKN